jgi:hypothetical protein
MEAIKHEPQEPQGPTEQQRQHFAPGQVEPEASAGDLSAEVAAAVEREPGDRVRVTWIHGANYRCNWWAPADKAQFDNPGMYGLILTTHRVRQSRFLTVRKTRDGLLIQDRTRTS